MSSESIQMMIPHVSLSIRIHVFYNAYGRFWYSVSLHYFLQRDPLYAVKRFLKVYNSTNVKQYIINQPSFHCSCTLSSVHIMLNSVSSSSTLVFSINFIISSRMLTVPAALFFGLFIATLIFYIVMSEVSISSSFC